jgi:hypothetical protein
MLAVYRSVWDGFVFGVLQALAPVCFRGNWAESFFGTAGQRNLLFWQPYRQNNKGAGQGARQGVAVDAARLVVNEGRRVCCALFATNMTAQGLPRAATLFGCTLTNGT